jgi:hypothetical protein
MEIRQMTYKELGSQDVSILVERRSENNFRLEANGKSELLTKNCLLVLQIKSFLNMIGLSDISGLRSANILKLIKQI